MRQEYFIEYPQHVFGLPDLPVRDARPFPQVSQKSFYILSGGIFQRFFSQKTLHLFRPPDIEGRTLWSYPVLLRAPPLGFPKNDRVRWNFEKP